MKNINTLPKLYDLKEVSQALGIPMGTLYNMRWKRELPCIKIGKRIKMTEENIMQLIYSNEEEETGDN